jgi:PAS domain S-box-containing protein
MEGKRLKCGETAPPQPEEAAAWLAAIVASSDDAIIGKRLDGTVVSWNEAAARLFGYREEEMIGQSIRRLIPDNRQQEEDSILARIAAGERVEHYATIRRRKDGAPVDVSVTISPVRNAAGEIVGASKIARDITQQKQSQDLQRESELRMRLAQDAAHAGTWEWRLADNVNIWSESLWDLYGLDPAKRRPSYEAWAASIHPDDRERVFGAIGLAAAAGEEFEAQWRVNLPEGEPERWLLSRGKPLGPAGAPERYLGIVIDITERKRAEEALRKNESRLNLALAAGRLSAWDWDVEKDEVIWNDEHHRILGYAVGEATASYQTFLARVHPEDRSKVEQAFGQAVKRGGDYRCEFRVVWPDGTLRWLEARGKMDLGAEGQTIRSYGVMIDTTERKLDEDHVKLLLREVNHRTKNMLALVLAIARQTLATRPEDFMARFGERVQALAVSQDLLVKNDWKGVNLRELFEAQLAPFKELIGARIELSGPAQNICAAAAQTLGMALHELAANAGAYGALSNAAGRVEIAWSFVKDGAAEETFSISWRERGGPRVSEPDSQGFGSAVIGRLVESSLDAKVEHGFPPEGFEWRLQCRACELFEGVRQTAQAPEPKPPSGARLRARPRILVVEDEPLVALEMAHILREASFDVVGPAGSVAAAAMLLQDKGCDAAVLDINLGKETSEPVALELLRRRVPFIAVSGYAAEQLPASFQGVPAISKPLRPELLLSEIRRRLAGDH